MAVLSQVARHAEHLADWLDRWVPHCQGRDLARARQLLLQERGRNFQDVGDIVEAVGLVVSGSTSFTSTLI